MHDVLNIKKNSEAIYQPTLIVINALFWIYSSQIENRKLIISENKKKFKNKYLGTFISRSFKTFTIKWLIKKIKQTDIK